MVLLAAPSSWPEGSLSDLVSQTDIIPYGVIKAIDNYSEGNSSLRVYVARYDFNGTSEEEMTILYDETVIQKKFFHNFSVGEDKIFFVIERSDGYHLVTNSSHPPYLDNTHKNFVKLHGLLIDRLELPSPTWIPPIEQNPPTPEADTPYSEYYWYAFVAFSIALIGFISYIYLKKNEIVICLSNWIIFDL